MAEVTVLVVNQNNADLLRLAVESFRYHNANVKFNLWIWDNNSTDGAQEWARENCDQLFIKQHNLGHNHAHALDAMARLVTPPYTLTLDNDVYFSGPVLERMLHELKQENAFAIGPAQACDMGTVPHYEHRLKGQQRIDPCCALFKAPDLARMVSHVSFVPFECCNAGQYFDTCAMIRHAAEGAGFRVIDAAWIWSHLKHYGSMTLSLHAPEGSATRNVYDERKKNALVDAESFYAWMRPVTEVVVAKYKESMNWLRKLDGMKVTVYDKSDTNTVYTQLPNVGREAHTYAEHVARNYDELAEVTVFTQGDPFAHAEDFFKQVHRPTTHFRSFGPHRLLTGADGDSCHGGLPIKATFEELTKSLFPDKVPFAPGALFMAHRNVLKRYPRNWWRRLADKLADPATQKYLPWTMERLWYSVLTLPPRQHKYHTIVGWFNFDELYRKAVAHFPDGAHFVEVGAWMGRSTSYMATEILNSHKDIRFDVVDHFRGSDAPGEEFMRKEAIHNGGTVRSIFENNLGDLCRLINVKEMDSVAAATTYENHSLDFCLIDAGHDYESVKNDIRAWLPKMKPGVGWLCGDDLTGCHPGVVQAVEEAFHGNIEFIYPTTWIYKVP